MKSNQKNCKECGEEHKILGGAIIFAGMVGIITGLLGFIVGRFFT